MKIGIIGAGASGMVAAIAAADDPRNEVLLFERQARVGRKLLATGNGRCNLSHWNAGVENYHGSMPGFVEPALKAMDVSDTLHFFRGLGLYTVAENSGRIYPYSDQANSVVDVLRFALERPNIRLLCGKEISSVKKTKEGFALRAQDERFEVDRLVIACGGAAGTKLGGGLSGYQLLRSLGHHCTRLYPSLVQLKTETDPIKGLKGVRANAGIELRCKDSVLARSRGEVQFTEYGVSGPAIFDLSRAAATAPEGSTLHMDLLPELTADRLLTALCLRIVRLPNLSCADLLTGILHNRLGRVVLRSVDIPETLPLHALRWVQLAALSEAVHDFTQTLTGTMGMDGAQVTAGGAEVREFDPKTLESRIVPGLYACGEVLDVDGDCGGYNLQWAWSSGHLAGKSAGGAKA